MQVFDRAQRLMGQCTVNQVVLSGTKFMVVIAEEGDYCGVCQNRHSDFREIYFDICIYDQWRTGLIADCIEDARHLPGFEESPVSRET